MTQIKFYSTHCPKCNVLEKKLKEKGLEYIEINDVQTMRDLGLRSAPALQIDGGNLLNFREAVEWVETV